MKNEKKSHWEKVYLEKSPDQVSWTQVYPTVSMEMITGFNLDKSAPIIDIGGGRQSACGFFASGRLQRYYRSGYIFPGIGKGKGKAWRTVWQDTLDRDRHQGFCAAKKLCSLA